jgi:FtsP/CotA-like multicopper oxidase with cupredoxin domain
MRRRDFLKWSGLTGATLMTPAMARRRSLGGLIPGLSDPALQPKFAYPVPDALAPGFKYTPIGFGKPPKLMYRVAAGPTVQKTGLVGAGGELLETPLFGYGSRGAGFTWPGRTFEVQSGVPTEVFWQNKLLDEFDQPVPHPITSLSGESDVDTSLHWAYSLHGYESNSIEDNGVPIVTHLHGGHSDSPYDGNPEYFFSPGFEVRGPRWTERKYLYRNDQAAGNLWYHDHALGITRLNVYAGMAGFYFVRDVLDTGKPDNPLGLPAWPYEKAYAIQDRMFKANGELFYPAYEGDPFWDDFITGEGATPPIAGGPSALAEFFGDHIVVNGVIWPKQDVERRHYRLRLLNGTDSRFMVVRFRPVPAGATTLADAGAPLPFHVIGGDQGLASSATQTDLLVFEPGARYDVVIDFSQVPMGTRVILENLGGDAPFGGDYGDDLAAEDFFADRQTDRIMAFDVVVPTSDVPDSFDPSVIAHYGGTTGSVTRTRKVALFEGMDEYGRLQPLLGTAEPGSDYKGDPVLHPTTGQPLEGAVAWHMPTTENPALDSTEVWEIYNATGDAHPVHLHLVNFEVLDRQEFGADVVSQPVLQHNGAIGQGFRLENIQLGGPVPQPSGYVENMPKDMVTALPEQVTRIKVRFDKPGRYVWHCHILSHEDHEMMRVLHVGPGA